MKPKKRERLRHLYRIAMEAGLLQRSVYRVIENMIGCDRDSIAASVELSCKDYDANRDPDFDNETNEMLDSLIDDAIASRGGGDSK